MKQRRRPMRRKPTATERRLIAIHESDKSLTVLIAPILGAVANFVAFLWFVGMSVSLANGAAEGILLLALAAIPVLLFWLLGRAARSAAQRIKVERSGITS